MLLSLALQACRHEPDATQAAEQASANIPGPVAQDPGPLPTAASNLVLICLDTVRSDAFFDTRVADQLSPWLERAQIWRDAMSVSSWTIPSVATVFTGWYPRQHQAGEFPEPVANLRQHLPNVLAREADTLAEQLVAAGFRTAAISGHSWLEEQSGLEQGFQQVHSRQGRQATQARFHEWLDENMTGQRWFAYLHFMEAHDWHLATRPDFERRLAGIDPGLRVSLTAAASPAACADASSEACLANQVYLLGVRDLRLGLAEILAELERRQLLETTAVLVFADHGEEFLEHAEAHRRRGDPRGEYGLGHGHSLYQELLDVPLLGWLPGVAGANHSAPASLVDVLPSALAWLGLAQPDAALPGVVLPSGSPSAAVAWENRVRYASGIAYGPQAFATRRGAEKTIYTLPTDSFEFYALDMDPAEQRPLDSDTDQQHWVMAFDALTADYLELASMLPLARAQIDEAQLRALQAIGYLQGVEPEPQPEPESGKAGAQDGGRQQDASE